MPQAKPTKRLSKILASPPVEEGEGSAIPSKSTLEEVQKFLDRYAREVSNNGELSQTSKTMYIDFATCFVRWMYGGFQPGSRGRRALKFTHGGPAGRHSAPSVRGSRGS